MNNFIKQAFTLIELLVVIAIIGILSGLIVVSMGGMTQKATIAKAQVFSNSLRNSLMLNLVSEWKFDESSGTTTDDSWKELNNGTLNGFVDTASGYGDTHTSGWISSANCISGSCLKFDGVDDFVNIPDSSDVLASNTNTIEAWIYPTKYVTYNQFISKSGRLQFFLSSVGLIQVGRFTAFQSGGTAPLNQWTHIVATFNAANNNSKIYMNGTNKADGTVTPDWYSSSSILAIGKWSGSEIFSGLIDNVRIYNAIISTSQIKKNYYSGLNSLLASRQINKKEYVERVNLIANE